MTEPDRAPLRWRGNVHGAVAWLADGRIFDEPNKHGLGGRSDRPVG
jgi:hypothetical protein